MATPDEWDLVPLLELAVDERNSFVIGPFGSDLVASDYRSSGVPVVFVRDIVSGRFRYKSHTFVDRQKADRLAAHATLPGDVLVTKMGNPPGTACVHPPDAPASVITADVIRVRPNPSKALGAFLAYALNGASFSAKVATITGGLTRPKLTLRDYRALTIELPPLPEQRKIAAILSSIDETIEKTEAVIEQLRVVKKAMTQELLTRGMPGRHTRFKQTEIGEIPEGWEVGTLASASIRGPQNGLYKSADFYGTGVPMLDMGDLFRSHVVEPRERRRLRLSSVERERFQLGAGDLLFARRSLVPEGAGQCSRVPDLEEYPVFESSIIRFSPDPTRCSSNFLAHFWNGPPGQALRMSIVRVVAVSGVTGADLAALPMPMPPVAEQQEIATLLDQIDQHTQYERDAAEAGRRVKKAVASVLLSGDLRVTPDEAAP